MSQNKTCSFAWCIVAVFTKQMVHVVNSVFCLVSPDASLLSRSSFRSFGRENRNCWQEWFKDHHFDIYYLTVLAYIKTVIHLSVGRQWWILPISHHHFGEQWLLTTLQNRNVRLGILQGSHSVETFSVRMRLWKVRRKKALNFVLQVIEFDELLTEQMCELTEIHWTRWTWKHSLFAQIDFAIFLWYCPPTWNQLLKVCNDNPNASVKFCQVQIDKWLSF